MSMLNPFERQKSKLFPLVIAKCPTVRLPSVDRHVPQLEELNDARKTK
jgi:hypothetical protein